MSGASGLQVSLSAHPAPVFRYEFRDGVPTVSATNDAFDGEIGVAEATPVAAVFDQFDTVESPGDASLEAQLRAGDPVEFVLGSADGAVQYVAHVLAPDANGATVVFSERDTAGRFGDDVEVAHVASAISHDLRNPLDVAGAHLEAARETGGDEHFDAVATAHDRMERIIQEVLTLARGEAALDVGESVSVRETVERAWRTVDTEDWRLDLDAPFPTARADADRLQRLFENLFRNAVEHAADGGTVRVGALADENAGVFVADDGTGIPSPEREAVMDPGYTVDGGGTGLGLALVDQIAQAHGWTVSITESDRGGIRVEMRFGTEQ